MLARYISFPDAWTTNAILLTFLPSSSAMTKAKKQIENVLIIIEKISRL